MPTPAFLLDFLFPREAMTKVGATFLCTGCGQQQQEVFTVPVGLEVSGLVYGTCRECSRVKARRKSTSKHSKVNLEFYMSARRRWREVQEFIIKHPDPEALRFIALLVNVPACAARLNEKEKLLIACQLDQKSVRQTEEQTGVSKSIVKAKTWTALLKLAREARNQLYAQKEQQLSAELLSFQTALDNIRWDGCKDEAVVSREDLAELRHIACDDVGILHDNYSDLSRP